MKQFGLIGYPLTHSFSEKYFSTKFEKEGLKAFQYKAYPIESISELPKLIQNNPLLHGLNVTIPYKEQVLPFLTSQSEVVKSIRACNCIKITGKQLIGYNTDVIGFERSLKKKLQAHHTHALILGTGGAAKAVEYVLNKIGIVFLNVSRKEKENSIGYEELDSEIISKHTLIVNTTPLGMYPGIETMPPIPYDYITDRHYLFDLIYNPAVTLFLQKGIERGALTENGMDMLVIQAEESFKIWNKD